MPTAGITGGSRFNRDPLAAEFTHERFSVRRIGKAEAHEICWRLAAQFVFLDQPRVFQVRELSQEAPLAPPMLQVSRYWLRLSWIETRSSSRHL
jgi:hypothetical protein